MLTVIITILDSYRMFLIEPDSVRTTLLFRTCDHSCHSNEETEAIGIMDHAQEHTAGSGRTRLPVKQSTLRNHN